MKRYTEAEIIEIARLVSATVLRCRQCQRVYGFSKGYRIQRDYCTNKCRQKSYRLRRGQKHARPGRPRKT